MSGKTWTGKGDWKRPDQTSEEESKLRWAVYKREIKITQAEFDRRIAKIRKRTGKP